MGNERMRDFKFRVQSVQSNSTDEAVLDFARSGTLMPMNQILVWSLKMCWLPFACRWQSREREVELQSARDAVYQLEKQIEYICDSFNLERPGCYKVAASGNGQAADAAELKLRHKPHEELQEDLPGVYDLNGLGFDDL
jgi:hypothetical protein